MAPRKVRSVADLIRGLPVNEAEAQLMAMNKRAALPFLKLLRSAVSNLRNNRKAVGDGFYVENLMVDGGPMVKRSLPRARGMATPIQRKMSHITMVLGEKPDLKPKFKIVVPKKIKLPPEESKSPKKEKQPQKEKKSAAETKKPGFFRRIFSRKSGFAK